jgi:hypothetical protein
MNNLQIFSSIDHHLMVKMRRRKSWRELKKKV